MLIIATFNTCKHDDTYYTVKGRILNSCNGVPFANQEIALKQSSSLSGRGGVLNTTSTDANGYFTFTYNSSDCIDGENMSINCSGPIIEYIPTQQNIEIGTFFSYGIANFTISLVTSRPFTSADTLYYTNYVYPLSNPARIKIGPFTNQVLDSIVSFSLGGPFKYGVNYSTLGVRYYVNHSNMNHYKDVDFNIYNCGNWGNVNIVLE